MKKLFALALFAVATVGSTAMAWHNRCHDCCPRTVSYCHDACDACSTCC